MSSDASPEERLERIEERLERMEQRLEESRRQEQRRRRQQRWARIAFVLGVIVAYAFYLRLATGLA